MSSRRLTLTLAIAAALGGGSCNVRPRVIHPIFPDGGMLRDATPLAQSSLAALEGFYDVHAGSDLFGRDMAARASPGRLSFFGPTEAVFSILQAGCLDGGDTLVLEGAWRYATTTDTGLVRLFVAPAAAAHALCAGEKVPADAGPIQFTGTTGRDYDLPSTDAAFERRRDLASAEGKFVVIAHHGTQTIDDYGTSENTIESFRLSQALGADSIEIDVRMTKDGVPILFHDPVLSARLVEGRFCHGTIADLTFAEIRANCRSKYGEPIYSLDEGLRGLADETTFGGVWLDVKETQGVAPTLAAMQRADAYATAKGRAIVHVIGLSAAEFVDAYTAANPPTGTRCLVEYDPAVALSLGCKVWGPRFTEGPQKDQVLAAQNEGLAVLFWTVDGPAFMQQFLREAHPNGMISDMPGYAFYYFQSNRWEPKGGRPEDRPDHGSH